jgi:serine phosphatase RsbU (regulator of sigma subunit)
MSTITPFVGLLLFLLVNLVFSELSKRVEDPYRVEIVRSFVGPFLAAITFVTTQDAFGGWWVSFLIMCLGGNILHTILTQRAWIGRLMVIIYIVVLVVCSMLIRPKNDWYMMAVYVGAIATTGLLFVEILLQLSKALFNERATKNEIENQRNRVEEQRAIIERKNLELERTYLHITDSIKYAKRIQIALVPLEDKIRRDLPEIFFLNRPKEIVSGDFYWFTKKGPYLFLAVVDCTGHGVSGAIMTVIANNLLSSVINEGDTDAPAMILKNIDDRLAHTIQRHEIDDQEFSDGMDMALLRIDTRNRELVYAGARRPLYVLSKGTVYEAKGNRHSIGRSYEAEKQFTQETIAAAAGDLIYLFTDGYTDQFGGDMDKKFTSSRFRDLLVSIADKEMYEQHFLLDRKLKMWRGNTPQTDDVMVVGFRL